MRRRAWYEAEQAYADEQEGDLAAARQRVGVSRGKAAFDKRPYQGEEKDARPRPAGPRPWLRSVSYTVAGQVAVPARPYHQQATLVGAGGVAFDVSYHATFPAASTVTLPGDRSHDIVVYAGQELWMRSTVIVGMLAVIIRPDLDAAGNAIRRTDGEFIQ